MRSNPCIIGAKYTDRLGGYLDGEMVRRNEKGGF